MKTSICSHCWRSMRPHSRWTHLDVSRLVPRSMSTTRSLATTSRVAQQVASRSDSTSAMQPPPDAALPSTSSRTAESSAPSSNDNRRSSSAIPHTSTAEMQKQIASSLARGGGPTLTQTLAQKLRQTAKSTTESYITYGLTEAFFKSCAAQAPYTIPEEQRTKILTDRGPPKTAEGEDLGIPEAQSWWFDELGLQPTFSTWSQVAYLHMYLLTVKLRELDSRSAYTNYQRYLLEHFSHTAEDKMQIIHTITARGIRNKYLKDLFLQWRGVLAAYDEGLAKGDAVLAAAVWRNLWKGQEDVDWEKVAMVVAYMRRVISKLADVPLEDLVYNLDAGEKIWAYGREDLRPLVDTPSQPMHEP